MKPFLDSTDAVDDGPELARRMDRNGYLFVRGLLPADLLESVRRRFLGFARDAGWLVEGTDLAEALADLEGFCVEPPPEYMAVIRAVHELEEFHALQHSPELLALLGRLCGGSEILPHPRLIPRAIFPRREAYTTPPHQDFIPIQGTESTYTAWIPLSALPADMGGVQIAAGSHLGGIYDFRPALGAGGIEITRSFDGTWRGGPFAQGDVLFFHSLAVHRGVPNVSERLRMSFDARFQRVGDPISPDTLLPFTRPQTWEEIYAGWTADSPYRYYWEGHSLDLKEYDPSYHRKRDAMAMEMAEEGDPRARSALQRIVARDQDPGRREKARELLESLDRPAPG